MNGKERSIVKTLLATGSGPESIFFANTIAAAIEGVVGIIADQGLERKKRERVEAVRPSLPFRIWERLKREGVGKFPDMLYDHLYMRNEEDHVRRVKGKYFSASGYRNFPAKVPLVKVPNINAARAVDFVRMTNPDVMAVQGTSIIKEPILGMLAGRIMNVHGGLPKYRGTWPMFWALYYEDFDYLKASLHFIDPGIDTGDVIMEKKLTLEPGDDHHTLRAKYLVEGTYLTVEALRILERGETLPRIPQQEIVEGKCFYARDATREKRIELHNKLRKGLLKSYLERNGAS